jgi:hypothetical protein
LATANPHSRTSTARLDATRPAGPGPSRARPSPTSTVQPASSPVRSGRSTSEPASGAIASQPTATGRPVAYCAAASAVTATASSGPATQPPRT